MSGLFGVVSQKPCATELYYGTDYHSHLGTRRGGMAVYGKNCTPGQLRKERDSPILIL